ncbi:ExeM/NucH family extracellular endonuclease [uncultured Microbacterium sp.]|uniref:ExeM/NucH family extracellular endonuclease n=1 Tax=uncultured Microbacterium sp. TaxID=191216 RepID=UPI0028D4015A|nr:ExeM/NucH family extracellular endonuclease [uncultured Microbacterium sp.]
MRPSPRRLIAALTSVTLAAVGAVVIAPPASAASGDLLFSEYIEGTSFNKALEIYNPSTAAIDLGASGYSVQQYSNGSATAGVTVPLTGTVAPDGVFVLAHGSANAAILAKANLTSTAGLFNGDDAIALVKGTVIVDVIGQIGVDPGTEWGTGITSTADNTLRRNADLCVGDSDGSNAFDPAAQWAGYPTDSSEGLGLHEADCALLPAVDPEPDPGTGADCEADTVTIGSVQGSGTTSPVVDAVVRVEGVVVGDFQAAGGLSGYFIQDEGDGDPATSDSVFVYAPGAALDVATGDVVNVAGTVSEFASAGGTLTEITAGGVEICQSGVALPSPATLTLPATSEEREALEGMSVTLPQTLTILEYFEYSRFGSVEVGVDRQMQPTAVFEPGSPEAIALAAQNAEERITLDDGLGVQNPDPLTHPDGAEFTLSNTFRGGDTLANITGVLDYRFGGWAIQPTAPADYTAANLRPEVPEVGGDVTVASFNVLNYFTTLGDRGANTAAEFKRQEAKIVSAISDIDADVVGLIEIENNGTAVAALVDALNAEMGAGTYSSIQTGVLGTDAITTALIYKPATVQPQGDFAVLTSATDPRFADNNRPALAQTVTKVGGSEPVTVVVNHLKSKGSACVGDPDLGDGAGNCNLTRTRAAQALADWLATDPTGQGAGRELIIGDLNSYDKEDPIDVLLAAGYTDVVEQYQGEEAYSYVFDGQLGYLDYALAGTSLAEDVTGAQHWQINADEPTVLDYNTEFKSADQVSELFAPDPYRSSDHDPVVIGLDLSVPDTTPPTISVTADPSLLFPPNGKPRIVTIAVDAADDSGAVQVAVQSAVGAGSKKASIDQITETTFSVTAAVGAFYTITYVATDAAGNSTTASTVVRVGR